MNFKQVTSIEEIQKVRELFEEYASWLSVDFCLQDFDKELRELPGGYAPPDGRLFLATDEDQLAGCVAVRRLGPDSCELKRLYVRPGFRGRGLGRELAGMIIESARTVGYQKIRLDTLPRRMEPALSVYRSLGFKEIEPYYANPIEGTMYMELDLQ